MSKYKKLTLTPDREMVEVIEGSRSKLDVLRHFGFTSLDSRALKYIRTFVSNHNIPVDHWSDGFRDNRRQYTKQQVADAVADAMCISDVLRALSLSVVGGNAQTINKLITRYNLDISHFDISATRQRGRGKQHTMDTVFCARSTVSKGTLRSWVRKHNVLTEECTKCKLTEWQGESITLELDHIDGDRQNNIVSNLRYLCPNCHSQTPTFRGKNKR